LMVGGDLPRADAWTTSLLTNPEVIEVDQHSTGNHVALTTDKTVVWLADAEQKGVRYLAVFNLSESAATVHSLWSDLGLPSAKYELRDLWERKDLGSAETLSVNLPPHGSVLYKVSAGH